MRIVNFGEKLYMICRLILHGIGLSRRISKITMQIAQCLWLFCLKQLVKWCENFWEREARAAHTVSKPQQVNSLVKFYQSLHQTHRANDCMRSREAREAIKPTNVCFYKVLGICLHSGAFIHVHRPCSCWNITHFFLTSFTCLKVDMHSHNITIAAANLLSTVANTKWVAECWVTVPTCNEVERKKCLKSVLIDMPAVYL